MKTSKQAGDHRGTARLCAAFVGLVVTSLFVAALAEIPDIHRDAQYYLQSAILWPMGQVTFAGSWIGSRAFVVWMYHLTFDAFGTSTDSLAIVLAFIKLFTTMALATVCFFSIQNILLRTLTILAVAVLVFFMPLMNFPATDNLATMFLTAIWATWMAGQRFKNKFVALSVFSFIVGTSLSVRSEIVIFPLLLVMGGMLSRPRQFRWRHIAFSVVSLAVGAMLPLLLWNTWVPTAKPPSYAGALAIYRAIAEHGSGSNGPASAKLATLTGIDPDGPLPYWEVLGKTYILLGPDESNRLITAAGLEAIYANVPAIASATLADTSALLSQPGRFEITSAMPADRMELLSAQLKELDAVRIDTSEQYGNDAFYPTARLADNGIEWIRGLREAIPNIKIAIELPSAILLFSLAVAGVVALRDRDLSLLSIPIFGLAVVVLSALSQGVVYRYIAPALLLNLVIVCIAGAALASSFRRREVVEA